MSSIEHLFENAMYAMKNGNSASEELDSEINQMMLEEVGISKTDILYLVDYVSYYYKEREEA